MIILDPQIDFCILLLVRKLWDTNFHLDLSIPENPAEISGYRLLNALQQDTLGNEQREAAEKKYVFSFFSGSTFSLSSMNPSLPVFIEQWLQDKPVG